MNHAFNIGQRTGRAFPSQPEVSGEYIYFPSIQGGGTGAPGALRVKFEFCPTGPISIIAQSKFESFEPFRIDIVDNEGQPDE